MVSRSILLAAIALVAFGCSKNASDASSVAGKVHACGDKDKVHAHDTESENGTEALVPCSASGAGDYSAMVHIDTTFEGIKITIDATDDQVNMGALGSDVKNRDAVLVYPK